MPQFSKQFSSLPPYALADVPKIKAQLIEQGVDVIDLGADVSPEEFVRTVRENEAQMLCLSALLLTTMPMMGTTIELLRDSALGHEVKVMVGGAPVTASFADEVGADGYAPDAFSAADMAKELLRVTG